MLPVWQAATTVLSAGLASDALNHSTISPETAFTTSTCKPLRELI